MNKNALLADVIFLTHLAIVAFILFGWMIPGVWYIYMATLALTALSYLVFGRCILSSWEFTLRKRANPAIEYNGTWLGYYAPSFLKILPDSFWERGSSAFLIGSFSANLIIHLLK